MTISEFELVDPKKEDYNKDINFYIGSQLVSRLSALEFEITIIIWTVKIGPILSLNEDCSGGCYITARHEKDQWDTPDRSRDGIHTCAKNGEDGCLSLIVTEKNRVAISIIIDFRPLADDPWEWDLKEDEKTVGTTQYYDSYTFESGMKEGICPHRFYKVPARVWFDDDKTRPAADMAVTVSDELDLKDVEKDLVKDTTMQDGSAALFLPYQEDYRYNLVANGSVDDVPVAGSKSMDEAIQMKENPPVDIILKSEEKVNVRTIIDWDADIDDKEVPQSGENVWIALESRKADGMSPWEIVDRTFTSREADFAVDDFTDLPKFTFENEQAYLLKYRTRLMESEDSSSVISPENGNPYITYTVGSYVNAAGESEPQHDTQYRVSYDDTSGDDIYTTTIRPAPVMDVTARKLWRLSDPEKQADFVYLALLHKPEEGWEELAEAEGIPGVWLTIRNPYSGDTNTISQLKSDGILTLIGDAGRVEAMQLTIGKVNDGNSWLVTYRVPKYREGVKLQYQGRELDDSVIEDFLLYEYGISATARVEPFGDYTSVPGKAHPTGDSAEQATVINRDPEPKNRRVFRHPQR